MSEIDDFDLEELKTMTIRIRNHEQSIKEISGERTKIAARLRRKAVSYRRIAEAMGVSQQNVYKLLLPTGVITPRPPKAEKETPAA
jgi:hypothetical protein